ncbi:MAG: hypothetical protein QFC78_11885 [Pseudomonadota bacterium]|nr:hypothetical protein [Pseudomonadota bacterium]
MAILAIEVKLDKGASEPFVAIDHKPVAIDNDGKGTLPVTGNRGDGSNKDLIVSFRGVNGATLGITISCAGDTLCEIKALTIWPSNEPFGGSHRTFKL